MAVEGALAICSSRTVDVGANLGDNGGAKGHVWHEMAVHDIHLETSVAMIAAERRKEQYMKPVSSLCNGIRTCLAELSEVGRQYGGSDDSGRGHDGGGVAIAAAPDGRLGGLTD